MDYKARFYSPLLGRFIQPDTITPGGPQGLNRYSYVNNSPINFNDPTGNRPCGDGEKYDCDGKSNKKPVIKSGSGCGGVGQKRCGGDNPTYGNGLIGPSMDPCKSDIGCWLAPKPAAWESSDGNYWGCYDETQTSVHVCNGNINDVIPSYESIDDVVTTADLHDLTTTIQFESAADWSYYFPEIFDFITIENTSPNEFAKKVDDGLIEYALANNQTTTVTYEVKLYGPTLAESQGNLSVSTEGYGAASITLDGPAANNARIWFDTMWSKR